MVDIFWDIHANDCKGIKVAADDDGLRENNAYDVCFYLLLHTLFFRNLFYLQPTSYESRLNFMTQYSRMVRPIYIEPYEWQHVLIGQGNTSESEYFTIT